MPEKYHINPETGDPGKCSAVIKCPFGGESEHYPTAALARIVYEMNQRSQLPVDWSGRNSRGIRNIENPDLLERMDGKDMTGLHLGNFAAARCSHFTQGPIGWLRMAADDKDRKGIEKALDSLYNKYIPELVEEISSKMEGDNEENKYALEMSLKKLINPLLERHIEHPHQEFSYGPVYRAWAEDAVKIAGKTVDPEKILKFN